MPLRILWFDNDPGMMRPFIGALERARHVVQVVRTISKAEHELLTSEYNLLILDVMIPTVTTEEEASYAPSVTNHGGHTGLEFWKRHRAKLKEKDTATFIFTVWPDRKVRESFLAEGLDPRNYATKMEICEERPFLDRILEVAARGA